MKRVLVAALVAATLVAAPVLAQEQPIYVWISFLKARPGQSDTLTRAIVEDDAKIFDGLVDSGAAVDWGVAMPVVHDGKDPYSHVEWISFVGWAGADAFMARFNARMQAMSKEEGKAMSAKWDALIEPGSHSDQINRSVHIGAGSPGTVGYIHLGYYQARPGKMAELKKMYMDAAVPVYDKLVADGKIVNYGLHTPAVHRSQGWDYMSWYMSGSLAARDAVDAAFDAAEAARSEAENTAMDQRLSELMDPSGHSDQILLVVHHKTRDRK